MSSENNMQNPNPKDPTTDPDVPDTPHPTEPGGTPDPPMPYPDGAPNAGF